MNSPDPWRVMQSSPPAPVMVVPAPCWGHPFFGRGIPQGWAGGTSPAWEQGFERGTRVFVGGTMNDFVDQIAPVMAPARGGFTAYFELDEQRYLHAEVCVDGKCYHSTINLGPAIAAVMARLAAYHADLHAVSPYGSYPVVSGEGAVQAVDKAVNEAGEAAVTMLLNKHHGVLCGSFL